MIRKLFQQLAAEGGEESVINRLRVRPDHS